MPRRPSASAQMHRAKCSRSTCSSRRARARSHAPDHHQSTPALALLLPPCLLCPLAICTATPNRPPGRNPQKFQTQQPASQLLLLLFLLLPGVDIVWERGDQLGRRPMATVAVMCGAAEERVVGTHKAPGACPRCGGAVVATDVESERRILCLPLCLKNKRKYSCTRIRRIRLMREAGKRWLLHHSEFAGYILACGTVVQSPTSKEDNAATTCKLPTAVSSRKRPHCDRSNTSSQRKRSPCTRCSIH